MAGQCVNVADMPNTDRPPTVASVVAERYGLPTVDGPRARLIATLHALIAWITEHPDVPVPGFVELRHFPVLDGGTLSRVDLVDLAHRLDGVIGGTGTHIWMKAPVLARTSGGARVDYVAYAGTSRRDGQPT
jgi:hypothetical protein